MPTSADPTFYRTAAAAAAAPPEKLAYVAAFDPKGEQHDAMTVIDCDAESPTYGGSSWLAHSMGEYSLIKGSNFSRFARSKSNSCFLLRPSARKPNA